MRKDLGKILQATMQAAGTVTGADTSIRDAKGAIFTVDVTLATSVSVVFTIQGYDPTSAKWVDILASAAKTATGTFDMIVYPGVTVAANVALSQPLHSTFRVKAVSTGTSYTATVGCQVIG